MVALTERILLVGGTGFLGSFVADRLADRALAVLARPSSDLSVLPPGVEVRFGCLEDAELPLQGVSSVVYCASMAAGHIPHLLEQLHSCRVRRAVFLSSTAIFTSLPAASRSVRLAAEAQVQSAELDWTILRPTMIYGTARDRNISRLLRFLKRWPAFPLCGNALWQPVHVEDLADAVVAALDSSTSIGRVYNLAGAYPIRFDQLLRTAARAVGRSVVLLPVPISVAVLAARVSRARVVSPEQIRRLAEDKSFDYANATRDFGFHPRSFAAGVRQEAQTMGLT